MTGPFAPQDPPFGDDSIVDGGGYLYRNLDVLVHPSDVTAVDDELTRQRARRVRLPDPLAERLAQYRLAPGTDTPGVVDLLRYEFPDARVQLNHVWTGQPPAPRYHGGPSGPPSPVDPPPIPVPFAAGSIRIAVLDTGMSRSVAPALAAHLDLGRTEWDDVYIGGKPPTIGPMGGHGTMAAGVIARYAPSATIIPIRVLTTDGWGTEVDILAGIDRAIAAGADILSLSLGGYAQPTAAPSVLEANLDALPPTVSVVAAAGNDGRAKPFYPACLGRVVGVAAADTVSVPGQVYGAGFSNRGPWVDVCAPGEQIASNFVTGDWNHGGTQAWFDGGAVWSGTSFATPHAAAAIAVRAESLGYPAYKAELDLRASLTAGSPGFGLVLVPPYT